MAVAPPQAILRLLSVKLLLVFNLSVMKEGNKFRPSCVCVFNKASMYKIIFPLFALVCLILASSDNVFLFFAYLAGPQ